MAKGIRICKICGEPYEYCYTDVPVGTNRWQDVACCIEHAAQYFREIAISRGELIEDESEAEAPVEENLDEDLEEIVKEVAEENELDFLDEYEDDEEEDSDDE